MKKGIRYVARAGIAALALAVGSCGDANVKGFNAPVGYTVVMPEDISVSIASTLNIITTVQVLDTDNKPANGIQVQLVCTQCALLDKATNPDGSPIQGSDTLAAVMNPYIVKTGSSGTYQFVAQVQAPAALGLKSYDAQLAADIGVASKIFKISVKTPE